MPCQKMPAEDPISQVGYLGSLLYETWRRFGAPWPRHDFRVSHTSASQRPYSEIRVLPYNTVRLRRLQATCSPGCEPDSGRHTSEESRAQAWRILVESPPDPS